MKISITLTDALGWSQGFKDTASLESFLHSEIKFWTEQHERIKGIHVGQYLSIQTHFDTVIKLIESWKNLDEMPDNVEAQLTQRLVKHCRQHWVWRGHPWIEAYVTCIEQFGKDSSEAFLEYVTTNQVANLQNTDRFRGALLAYESSAKDSDLTKRSAGEAVALITLRENLQQTSTNLIEQTEEFKNGFNTWLETNKENYESNKTDRAATFDEYMDACKQKIASLEETYEEKLRLKSPAKYWKDAATKFKTQGFYWAGLLVLILGTGLVIFYHIFIVWLHGKQIQLELNSLQGVIMFGSIVAVFAYLVRVISRLVFSSFHLQRDAEEREQLTHLYLALSEGTEIDTEARQLVLQALFSRSETGLLANDGGPTMPGAGDAIKAMSTVARSQRG